MTRRLVDPFVAMREEMESMLERFTEGWRLPEEWVEPRNWEVTETENEVLMRLEAPGFEAREITVNLEGNVMVVRAEHPEAVEEPAKTEPRVRERFVYRLTLPYGTDAEHIEATYRNGILEVHFPRLPEARPRRIELKT